MKKMTISAEEFDRIFDEGGDISEYLDHAAARQPNLEPVQVTLDLPRWMVKRLDTVAKRLGVTRESLFKIWLGEILDRQEQSNPKSVIPEDFV